MQVREIIRAGSRTQESEKLFSTKACCSYRLTIYVGSGDQSRTLWAQPETQQKPGFMMCLLILKTLLVVAVCDVFFKLVSYGNLSFFTIHPISFNFSLSAKVLLTITFSSHGDHHRIQTQAR